MFYWLSKTIWTVADPANFLLLAALLGMALLWSARPRAGRAILTVVVVILLIVSVVPVGGYALGYLENRFPPPSDEGQVDGIIVLGGAINAEGYFERPGSGVNGAFGRILEAARLARRHPAARVILSGGPKLGPLDGRSEADAARVLLSELGVAPERIELETDSRDTYENAEFVGRLVHPAAGQRWLLVTSAFHMPRAMGCFRAVGFPVSPFPVDYKYDALTSPRFDLFDGLSELKYAIHEYVGLIAYRLAGKTQSLIPGP